MGCTASALDNVFNPKLSNGKAMNGSGKASLKKSSSVIAPMEKGESKFDPRLPLTSRQKYNIMKSWKGIARNIEGTGILMFCR